uniref:Uncharacterized protein n=1 Tax=Bionectria ochroleuca TaxID=29856 RepID=A0A8H7NI65_BIOOC
MYMYTCMPIQIRPPDRYSTSEPLLLEHAANVKGIIGCVATMRSTFAFTQTLAATGANDFEYEGPSQFIIQWGTPLCFLDRVHIATRLMYVRTVVAYRVGLPIR